MPATMLFLKEKIGTYVRLQLQQPNIPQSRHYALPTALEHEAFTKWRKELQGRCCPGMLRKNLPEFGSIFTPPSPQQVEGNVKHGPLRTRRFADTRCILRSLLFSHGCRKKEVDFRIMKAFMDTPRHRVHLRSPMTAILSHVAKKSVLNRGASTAPSVPAHLP